MNNYFYGAKFYEWEDTKVGQKHVGKFSRNCSTFVNVFPNT